MPARFGGVFSRDPFVTLEKATASENLVGFSDLEGLTLYYNVLFFGWASCGGPASPPHTKRRDGVEYGSLIVLRLCPVERFTRDDRTERKQIFSGVKGLGRYFRS